MTDGTVDLPLVVAAVPSTLMTDVMSAETVDITPMTALAAEGVEVAAAAGVDQDLVPVTTIVAGEVVPVTADPAVIHVMCLVPHADPGLVPAARSKRLLTAGF